MSKPQDVLTSQAVEHMELHANRLLGANGTTTEAEMLAKNVARLAEALRLERAVKVAGMPVLLRYADRHEAKEKGWPRQGTRGEIASLVHLAKVQERFGYKLILHPPGEAGAPTWADYMEVRDAEDADDDWAVRKLPEDWKSWRWLEVYNGRRE